MEHEVIWTKDKVARFWNYYSTSKAVEDNYFSKQLGDTIIAFVKRYIRLSGDILDYGCGPGFLIEKLLNAGFNCWGLDGVESNIKIIKDKFGNIPHFKGGYYAEVLPTTLQDNQFDVVFLVETIEHLLKDDLQAIVHELHRLTKIGGKLIITTRNNEKLSANQIICPDCGCVFHPMQHITTWTTNSLSELMSKAGYKKIICTATTFRPKTIWGFYKNITDAITHHLPENLIYIGEKI